VVVSGLDQLPAFPPFLTKEVLQPFNASTKDIVDKTEATLIAFDSTFLFFGLPLGQFVNRNLIFPLGHKFHLLFCSLDTYVVDLNSYHKNLISRRYLSFLSRFSPG